MTDLKIGDWAWFDNGFVSKPVRCLGVPIRYDSGTIRQLVEGVRPPYRRTMSRVIDLTPYTPTEEELAQWLIDELST